MIDNYGFCELKYNDLLTVYGGNSEDIASNLKLLRSAAGIKRIYLANELNLDVTTVARYEEGTRVPDIDTLIKISNVLGVEMNDLIF
ncbi:helix-turn-helix transcriptional regulator [Leuconostoc carnosum]|uniref:helix-turn-helix domain-containing protein n=1 Tax=Leuconostoc TaxID=1243 RepID=UPI000D508D04|nr:MULTISPECIES: helix-turn-helix transcriptional regulator [Leuconostoc]KAA8324539.1 helix-turn-helix transcriptional regulator [Leuconostoc carnosum]KAA8358212.1 helix-turn-helix transcriptional regulator [Leuconostoc carnosum]KAA8364710.1 helix-turn-helix transcriptional regulator [Leuconostoc carnosum]KAA8365583.1 helix-turn-helix transcriptional regulator [Leuconostoc carnosum]KAA8371611.1 helix-turn-helix transcriptional regulator [Leuconostoc carnosum]